MGKIERGGTQVPVGDGHAPSGGAGPVERTFMVRPALPCASCDHAAVCSIRPKLAAVATEFRPPISPDPAVMIAVEATVTCTYYRAVGKAPRSAVEEARTMASPATSADFRRTVSEADRIRTSSQRGAAASVEARRATAATKATGRKPWSPEARAAMSVRSKAAWAAKQAKAGE